LTVFIFHSHSLSSVAGRASATLYTTNASSARIHCEPTDIVFQ